MSIGKQKLIFMKLFNTTTTLLLLVYRIIIIRSEKKKGTARKGYGEVPNAAVMCTDTVGLGSFES